MESDFSDLGVYERSMVFFCKEAKPFFSIGVNSMESPRGRIFSEFTVKTTISNLRYHQSLKCLNWKVTMQKKKNVKTKFSCEAFVHLLHSTSHLRPRNHTIFPPMEDVPGGNVMLSCFVFNCNSAARWPLCPCPSLIFIYIIPCNCD